MPKLAHNILAGMFVILAAISGGNATAAVWYVDIDSTGTEDGSSWATAFKTIHPAVDAASMAYCERSA